MLEGFISLEAARDDYGVTMHPDTLEIDWSATEASRAERKSSYRGVDRGPQGEKRLRELGVTE